jgi:hypothetical protein
MPPQKKLLGWEYIDAVVMGGDETDARLWEISENLDRADLSVLEDAELTVEWEQLIKEKDVQVAQPLRAESSRATSGSARQRGSWAFPVKRSAERD